MTLRCFIIIASANELSEKAALQIVNNISDIDPHYKQVLVAPGRIVTLVNTSLNAQEIWTAVHRRTVSLASVLVFETGGQFAVGHDQDALSWMVERYPVFR